MQILLIEPYMGGSHRAWAYGFAAASAHEVTLVTLEARWWTWRMKGSAVTLAEKVAHLAEGGYRPDVILVSDMVDVAALRTFLHPSVGRPPLALYFHESQFTYPDSPQMTTDSSYPFLNWTSAVAADAVFFNSPYHREVFFSELPRLLKSFPDYTHTHLVDSVAAKTAVLPVGVDLSWTANRVSRDGPPLVLWNHRWEYDKDPETFADAIRAVAATHDFRLALAGERFRTVPGALDELADDLSDRIEANDHLPTQDYRSLLLRTDVVVSTALQEFFGISVVEAIAAGARPVLPNRLSYPWLIPQDHHGAVLYETGGFTAALRRAVEDPAPVDGLAEAMTVFDWSMVAPRYDAALESLL
jgi:glycosyltransferase involved in cell wall biosynthesis